MAYHWVQEVGVGRQPNRVPERATYQATRIWTRVSKIQAPQPLKAEKLQEAIGASLQGLLRSFYSMFPQGVAAAAWSIATDFCFRNCIANSKKKLNVHEGKP